MKTNKFMRISAVVLVAVLLSTCVIAGTFAKYVTTGTANDSARVGKWGVVITTWNTDDDTRTLFAADYGTTVTASNGTDKLVAPGTASANNDDVKDDDAETKATFSIKGTPEVDLKLDFVMNVTSDVVVPKGTYLDWTTANSTTDTFELTDDYYPVVFTLKQTTSTCAALKLTNGEGTTVESISGNLATIEAAFERLSQSKVEANTEMNEVYELTWEWVFDGNDKADTLLGNKAADIATDEAVKTQLTYDISITATQIDEVVTEAETEAETETEPAA